jgi:hypothetical protein
VKLRLRGVGVQDEGHVRDQRPVVTVQAERAKATLPREGDVSLRRIATEGGVGVHSASPCVVGAP